MEIRKIQIVCPANAVTGGPESLHNLVAVLQSLGEDASIVYYPFNIRAKTPDVYRHYGVAVDAFDDSRSTLVILPEIYYSLLRNIKNAKTAIWWLSLDNFLERKYHNWRDKVRYFIKIIKRERPLFGVKGIRCNFHLSKSYYDENYLNRRGIKTFRLAGPISNFYLNAAQARVHHNAGRKPEILYNSKKGTRATDILRKNLHELNFKSLGGMSEGELAAIYGEGMLYVDFGHHPGRERMPREAAVMGCCVVTGRLGSAGNEFDIPIPPNFKIDQFHENFVRDFREISDRIFSDFPSQSKLFDSYRNEILKEPITQKANLLDFLKKIRAI